MVNSLDEQQQLSGGFETPAEGDGALTNLVAIGQARDNLLSLKLDQVSTCEHTLCLLYSLSSLLIGIRLSDRYLIYY